MKKYIGVIAALVGLGLLANAVPANGQSMDENGTRDAKVTKQVPPTMPRQARESGYCCMVFNVDRSGSPVNVNTSYCTNPIFAESSKDAVSRWEFSPAMKNGKPVVWLDETTLMRFNIATVEGSLIPSSTGYLSLREGAEPTAPPRDRTAYRKWLDKNFITETTCGELVS